MGQASAQQVNEKDVVLSGASGGHTNSARAGFLPIGIDHAPVGALAGLALYLRARPGDPQIAPLGTPDASTPGFALYCANNTRFTDGHKRRLIERGVKFIYIRMTDQTTFRRQTEKCLIDIAKDPAVAMVEKSAIVYDTSLELMNELLAEPQLAARSPRLETVARATATLVMNDSRAFTHLFAASHHDFYTATHLVNVATWMVPLAYEMGFTDVEDLNRICQAGLLHDMGKLAIPPDVLNKKGKLTDDEWKVIRGHPEAGVQYLSRFENVHPLIIAVTREHHERLDGTGYPHGLKGDQIQMASRICAVVDSFDAMTAFRPFKERTLSVQQALAILKKEAPDKYDPDVVQAWSRLIESVPDAVPPPAEGSEVSGAPKPVPAPRPADIVNKRRHERRPLHCPARAHVLTRKAADIVECPALPMVAHSISRGGLGLLSQIPLKVGEFMKIYLEAPGWTNRGLEGQTVRCRTYDDNWSEIGFMFGPADFEALPESGKNSA